VLLEFAQLLTPDRHGRIQDAIEKMVQIHDWSSDTLFRMRPSLVPELIPAIGIKLNKRGLIRGIAPLPTLWFTLEMPP
jgi:hypothetical protein